MRSVTKMTCSMNIFAFLIFTFIILDSGSCVKEGSNCMVRPWLSGVCVKPAHCKIFHRLSDKESGKKLLISYCGASESDLLVCCPGPVMSVSSSSENRITEDVTNHPNIGLINGKYCGQGLYYSTAINNKELFSAPWMIIFPEELEKPSCVGVIISERYIISSAYCIDNTEPTHAEIGKFNLKEEKSCLQYTKDKKSLSVCAPAPKRYKIEDTIIHDDYVPPLHINNGIVLIKLEQPLNFTSGFIRPICLPVGIKAQTRSLIGEDATVRGWDLFGIRSEPSVPKRALVPVLDANECSISPHFDSVREICSGGNMTGADLGSPLSLNTDVKGTKKEWLYGILSYRINEEDSPLSRIVYTKIGFYMKWILDNMQQ